MVCIYIKLLFLYRQVVILQDNMILIINCKVRYRQFYFIVVNYTLLYFIKLKKWT